MYKKCDTIIYDRLGTYQLLDYVRPECKKIRYKMKSEIEKYGAKVYSLVDMKVEKTDNAQLLYEKIDNLESYTWIVFTSANGVEPVAANMGVVPPKKGFLQFLRDITKQ